MVEGTGLENRHTRKGIEGSNPSLSVMSLLLLLALQAAAPAASLGDLDGSYCLETGYCRAPNDGYAKPPAGLLFLATGVVAVGVVQLRRRST